MSILSTQDSNNQKKKDSMNSNKSKFEEKYRQKRNYTEYSRMEEIRMKQMKRDQSQKKRETSKQNCLQLKDKDNRTSQSKEKNNWMKPTQKPAYMDSRGFVGEK